MSRYHDDCSQHYRVRLALSAPSCRLLRLAAPHDITVIVEHAHLPINMANEPDLIRI